MSSTITHWEFNLLFTLMFDKWKQSFPNQVFLKVDDWIEIIGYPTKAQKRTRTNAGKPPNLCTHINETLSLEVDPVTPGHMYKCMRRIRNDKTPYEFIELSEIYNNVFFNYLGYNDYEAFRRGRYTITGYTGMYYSQTKGKICSFEFAIVIPRHVEGMIFPPTAWAVSSGFHDNITTQLIGEIQFYNKCWIAILKHKDYYMHLSIYTRVELSGLASVTQFNQLFGAVSAISSSGHLINVECVLAKKEHDAATELQIRRYLNVRRNYFGIYITEEDQFSMEGIKTADTTISDIDHLAGRTFRIMARGPYNLYIQSKFRIEEDYSAVISVPKVEHGKELQCRLFIDHIIHGRLLIFSYLRDQRFKIYTATAVEYVPKLEKDTILHGTYFTVNEKYMVNIDSYDFVLKQDNEPFDIALYKESDMKSWDEKNIRRQLMNELLR